MARVVVVGGGLGGIAASVRLAKLGHEVTLLEAAARVGGALVPVEHEGFAWDASASFTFVPAVLRDLFRKSGRPLEAELKAELEPLEVVREHRFADGTSVRLRAGGSRAANKRALDELGPGLGDAWLAHTDGYAQTWEVLRRHWAEVPWDPESLPRETVRAVTGLLDSRETLHKRLRRAFRDERLALVAAHPFVADGHHPRNVPAWAGVHSYLEQSFGAWRVPGGRTALGGLLPALERRLATRKVTVLTGTTALDLVLREGRAVAVRTAEGEHAADAVVVAVDPRRLPALAPLVERTMPALPPVVAHLGIEGEPPAFAHVDAGELVLHDEPLLVVRPGGSAPPGHTAWTVHGRGKISEDLVRALARHRIDIRDRVVTRVDLSPRDLVEQWSGSPHGVLWQGRGTWRQRLGPTTPVPGVYACGAHTTPGSGLPFVGLSAALVAQVVGPA